MKTQKIISPIIIGVIIISSIEFTCAQSKVNKSYFRYDVKQVTDIAREISKYRKTQFKHSEKGNLNEFNEDYNIKLESWMVSPGAWNSSNIINSEDAIVALEDWMLNPRIMGNKIESKDQVISLEDWMLSPEKMMNNSINNQSIDQKIELADWMLHPKDYKKIK